MTDSNPSEPIPGSAHENSSPKPATIAKEFRLGVLLVHGMGTQPARDTLVRWGDALLKLIGRATQPPVRPLVTWADPGDRHGEKPAEVVVEFSGNGSTEKWLLNEAWWADSFPPPTYSELVSWSIRALPWSITLHIAQRYWHIKSRQDASRLANVVGLAIAVIQLLIALALSPVFVALLAVTLLLGVLPIPQLRTLILSTQSLLLGTVGDSLAFVESPLRAALIRTRILDGLTRLKGFCESTVIIAHSQGAAATLDALGGIMTIAESSNDTGIPDVDEQLAVSDSQLASNAPVPDTLVTFGSGVNQLVSLKVLSGGLPKKMVTIGPLNPASLGVVAVLAMIGWFLFLYASIRSGRTTVPGLFQAAEFLLAIVGGAGLLIWGAASLTKKLIAKKKQSLKPTSKDEEAAIKKKAQRVQLWVIAVVMVCAVGAFFFVDWLYHLPMSIVAFLFYPLLFLVASLTLILSDAMAKAVAAPVRTPPGLKWWIDLFASADPVPNGPTRMDTLRSEETRFEPQRLSNRGSMFSDHTTYWENLDGFVLPVVRACALTAGSSWAGRLPGEAYYSDDRAAWRVDLLRWTVRVNTLLWLIAFVPLWARFHARIPLPLKLPAWAPVEAHIGAQSVILFVLVAMAAWGTSALLHWFWRFWVRTEQQKVLGHVLPAGKPWVVLIGMGMVTSLLIFSVKVLLFGDIAAVRKLLNDPGEWFGFLIGIWWAGTFLAWLALIILRPKSPGIVEPPTASGV